MYNFNSNSILFFLLSAYTVTRRHKILFNSIGTMSIENEAISTIWILIAAAVASFIILPIISTYFFKWINSSLHPMYEIISGKIEEEKNAKKTNSNPPDEQPENQE